MNFSIWPFNKKLEYKKRADYQASLTPPRGNFCHNILLWGCLQVFFPRRSIPRVFESPDSEGEGKGKRSHCFCYLSWKLSFRWENDVNIQGAPNKLVQQNFDVNIGTLHFGISYFHPGYLGQFGPIGVTFGQFGHKIKLLTSFWVSLNILFCLTHCLDDLKV